MLRSLKGQLQIPVILFTYSNPLLNVGMEAFCQSAAEAGAAGLMVPDLPLEEAERLSTIRASWLGLVLLVAPTTPQDRMGRIATCSRGFTYLVSVLMSPVSELRWKAGLKVWCSNSNKPHGSCCSWFWDLRCRAGASGSGLGCRWSDCGHALVKRMAAASPGDIAREAGRFCAELRAAADQPWGCHPAQSHQKTRHWPGLPLILNTRRLRRWHPPVSDESVSIEVDFKFISRFQVEQRCIGLADEKIAVALHSGT